MSGLLALLDDVAAIARTAAASVDDVAGMAAKAGTKAKASPASPKTAMNIRRIDLMRRSYP